jgi:hypothetical protein
MTFVDNALELLDRTEASLNSLIVDALKVKAYKEIATIAAMAEAVSAVSPGRARDGKRVGSSTGELAGVGAGSSSAKGESAWTR